MIIETWKDVEGYDGRYRISNLGRVRSEKRLVSHYRGGLSMRKERILKGTSSSRGYPCVGLSKDANTKSYRVHVLVAKTFIGDRPKGMTVSHIDGNSENNQLTNLCYESLKDNCRRRVEHGTSPVGEKNPRAKVNEMQVIEIRRLYATGKYLQRELGDMFNMKRKTISSITNMQSWRNL